MNTVIFSRHCDFFTFCRGGVSETLGPVDPYKRMGIWDICGTYKGYHIYTHGEEHKTLCDFFGFTLEELRELASNPLGRTLVCKDDFKVVFDGFGYPILYRAKDKDPKRVVKVCKSRTAFFKEWAGFRYCWASREEPVTVKGWKFDNGVKYIRMRFYDIPDLINLVPELFGIDPYPYIKKEFADGGYRNGELERKAADYLYGLDPIDLSKPYDYTAEEKAILAERKRIAEEEKRKAEEELERRKNTPGFCNECGAEDAKFIPYLDRYLCPHCFNRIIDMNRDYYL